MNRPKVLLAEDHNDLRQLLDMKLSSDGFDVVAACDGREAIDMIAAVVPDVLVTDLNMPRADGADLVKAVRAMPQFATLPVLLLTGTPDDPRSKEILELPYTIMMRKPPTWSEIEPTLKVLLAATDRGDPRAD